MKWPAFSQTAAKARGTGGGAAGWAKTAASALWHVQTKEGSDLMQSRPLLSLWVLSGAVRCSCPLTSMTIIMMTFQALSRRDQLPWGWGFIQCCFHWLSGSLFQKSSVSFLRAYCFCSRISLALFQRNGVIVVHNYWIVWLAPLSTITRWVWPAFLPAKASQRDKASPEPRAASGLTACRDRPRHRNSVL